MLLGLDYAEPVIAYAQNRHGRYGGLDANITRTLLSEFCIGYASLGSQESIPGFWHLLTVPSLTSEAGAHEILAYKDVEKGWIDIRDPQKGKEGKPFYGLHKDGGRALRCFFEPIVITNLERARVPSWIIDTEVKAGEGIDYSCMEFHLVE